MVRLFVRINVADYETWRDVYDQFYGERGAMGVMGSAAFQLVDDPNDVASARASPAAGSSRLRAACGPNARAGR
jgi:hypothetical protein